MVWINGSEEKRMPWIMHRALVSASEVVCVRRRFTRVARLKRTDFCASRFPAARPSHLRSWSRVNKWIDPHQPGWCLRAASGPVHRLTGHKVDVYGHKRQTFTAGKHPWSAGPITKAQSELEMMQLIPIHCNKMLYFEQKWIIQPTPWWTSCYTKQMCIYETKAMYINFDVFKRQED